jgi:hypothetical protein
MNVHSSLRSWSLATLLCLAGSAQAAETYTEAQFQASPWAFCSSAEWFGEYPKFNPLMSKAGIRWARTFPEWQTVQPEKGVWRWEGVDAVLNDLKTNNMRLTGCLTFFTRWATVKGDTRTLPLKDLNDWATYAREAAKRYQADIRDWEVYNEFNGSFAVSKDKPKDYAELVSSAYDAIKAVDPKLRIGMSCANFDLGFFDGAIKQGASGKFDFIAVHPYENLGTLRNGGESGYLSMAASIRKMLAENNQTQPVALWITEFGMQSTVQPNPELDAEQAEIIVKGYVLAIAQGFERIAWFEARGPSYGHNTDHGIVRHDWTPRPCYESLSVMTSTLGVAPKYLGWLNLSEGGYGFVFEGANGPLLCAWAPMGSSKQLSFASAVEVVDLFGKRSPLAAKAALELGRAPVYVEKLPAALVAEAKANKDKPFPWGGDFANAPSVNCLLGATNTENGIKLHNPQTTEVVHKLDHSYRTSHFKNGEGQYMYFRADPQFVGFGNKDLRITIVARREENAKAVRVNLCYESMKGYRGVDNGAWEIPAGEEWIEHSWEVHDANFAGGWGWNFRTETGGSAGKIAIKEVRLEKLPAAK